MHVDLFYSQPKPVITMPATEPIDVELTALADTDHIG